MVHSLILAPAPAVPISTTPRNTHIPSFGLQRVWACHQGSYQASEQKIIHRRTVTLSLAGALLGLNFGDRIAGAARRPPPPPPPPEEKKDPNVGGVTAKVLASKKRKEAMKESMAKLRERGKPIKEPSE